MNTPLTFTELTDLMMSHYRAGDYVAALELVERNADQFPEQSGRITFWRMCLLSLQGRPDDVLAVFRAGLDSGLWWADTQFADTDLDSVRDLPEFRRLVALSHERYVSARGHVERDYDLLVPERPAESYLPLLVALHGRNGSKGSHLQYWDVARRQGWLVLLAQSTQPLSSSSYCWDNPAQGLADISYYMSQVVSQYRIDDSRVVFAGFSQGSGMAILAALNGGLPARGFIGVATSWAGPDSIEPILETAGRVRGYFITGAKDHARGRIRELQELLKQNNIGFEEELHPQLAHEFPADFSTSFDNAINSIFKESE